MKKMLGVIAIAMTVMGLALIAKSIFSNHVGKSVSRPASANIANETNPGPADAMTGILQNVDDAATSSPTERPSNGDSITRFEDLSNRFLDLRKKAILDRHDQAEYDQMLSKTENIQLAQDVVTSGASENTRMHAIEFLAQATRVPSGRAEAETAIASAFAAKTITKSMDYAEKKSHAADKVELYSILKRVDPSRAQQLKTDAKSELVKRLINFTENFYFDGGKS